MLLPHLGITLETFENLSPYLLALAVALAAYLVMLPLLQKDELNKRMKTLAVERARVKNKATKDNKKKFVAFVETDARLKRFIDNAGIAKQVDIEATKYKLMRAGYRNEISLYLYLLIKTFLPFTLMGGALFYSKIAGLDADWGLFQYVAVAVFGLAAGWYFPDIMLSNTITKRQTSIERAFPDALDLLLICVGSGMSTETAFKKVSEEMLKQSKEMAEEMAITTAELSYLTDRRQAFDNLARRTGLDSVKGVVMALVQAEKYGTPLSQTLRVLAQDNRDMRMSKAEKKAAALPPKLTVPMVLFTLPTLFVIILTPAMVQLFAKM